MTKLYTLEHLLEILSLSWVYETIRNLTAKSHDVIIASVNLYKLKSVIPRGSGK